MCLPKIIVFRHDLTCQCLFMDEEALILGELGFADWTHVNFPVILREGTDQLVSPVITLRTVKLIYC